MLAGLQHRNFTALMHKNTGLRTAFCLFLKPVKCFAYTALFSILFSLYTKLHVCINYALNQDYYSEVLCENKEVENSCCKGKCAVEKELSDLGKKEEPQPGKNNPERDKLSKSEEALTAGFGVPLLRPLLSVVITPPDEGTEEEHLAALLRPPGC